MSLSVGVEYAFHSLFYMIDLPAHTTVGIKEIARLHGITETYLSKVFAKLGKAGIVRSVAGVRGGYELAKKAEDISFWDIVEAIEGSSYLFQCAEIRRKNIFSLDQGQFTDASPCLIKTVLHEAEDCMRDRLRAKSLRWLQQQVYAGFSQGKKQEITAWALKL